MLKKILLFILILSGLQASAQIFPNLGGQRAGTAAFPFLKNEVNARYMALGGGGIAIKDGAYASAINPAGMVGLGARQYDLSTGILPAGQKQGFLSVQFPSDNKIGAWGLTVNSVISGAQPKRTEFAPEGTGDYFYASNLALGVNYSRLLSEYFSYGLGVRYVREDLDNYHAQTATIDLGFLYRTDFKDLSFAVLLNNFGFDTDINGRPQSTTSLYKKDPAVTDRFAPPTTFKIGISFIPVKTEKAQLLALAELHHPNDNAENIRLGVEYSRMNLLWIRAGYKVGVVDKNIPTAGIGFRSRIGKKELYINYAAEFHNYLGTRHLVSVGLRLSNVQMR